MSPIRLLALMTALLVLGGAALVTQAAQVEAGSVYCFAAEDFSDPETPLAGICITALPDPATGTVLLGSRVLRPGDILTAGQVEQMTFRSVDSPEDSAFSMDYLPIYDDHVAPAATLTLAIRGRTDQSPIAEDSTMETYKNLENSGVLKVTDPEGQPMTFTLTRQPKRGSVTIAADGTFTYTPKKNKVGVDSFTYTATDPAGNVSRQATVTITILKPTDATQYTDTAGESCRFSAEWMKNTGIFVGENLAGETCFQPEKQVTRGEFVTMLVKALDVPVDEELTFTGYADVPGWLQPYLAAAIRSGLTAGLPERETFGGNEPITGGEAAVMLQNALDLSPGDAQSAMAEDGDIPQWASGALKALYANGILLGCSEPLTRSEAANALYLATGLMDTAPGGDVLRRQN